MILMTHTNTRDWCPAPMIIAQTPARTIRPAAAHPKPQSLPLNAVLIPLAEERVHISTSMLASPPLLEDALEIVSIHLLLDRRICLGGRRRSGTYPKSAYQFPPRTIRQLTTRLSLLRPLLSPLRCLLLIVLVMVGDPAALALATLPGAALRRRA